MTPSIRTVDDPAVLAALAHPTRRRLMDALKIEPEATVGRLAALLGVAVGSVSHHLKPLHRAGLIEPAPESARDRRETRWRLVHAALNWNSADFDSSPATAAIVSAAESLGLDRQTELARQWLTDSTPDDPRRTASFSTDVWLNLTPAELAELGAELQQTFSRWRDRNRDREPCDDQEPMFVYARGFPAVP